MKKESRINQLLKDHKLRKTPTRVEILALYMQHEHALSHKDIEETLNEAYDRVTIYRTLHSFEEKGIIHRVYDNSNSIKYALCGEHCHDHKHQDNHIHFNCTACHKTFCIEEIKIPNIQLPKKYRTESVHLFAKGLCDECVGKY